MNFDLLKRLCALPGLSGHEHPVTELLRRELEGLVDECWTDASGNLIAHKKGPGKKLLVAAHMDQIGVVVSDITESGMLRIAKVGCLNHSCMLTARFVFPGGVVGVLDSDELARGEDYYTEKLHIDIGATSRAEAQRYVQVGAPGVYYAPCEVDELKILSPALDNRVGCFIAIEALRRVRDPAWDLYLVFTVQEEVGLRGARPAAWNVAPDYALNLDTCRVHHVSGPVQPALQLGKGPVIEVMNGGMICPQPMLDYLGDLARQEGIPVQYALGDFGILDVCEIHLSRGGVPSGAISVPSRHLHTMSEVERLSDIAACVDLAAAAFRKEIG